MQPNSAIINSTRFPSSISERVLDSLYFCFKLSKEVDGFTFTGSPYEAFARLFGLSRTRLAPEQSSGLSVSRVKEGAGLR
jgi:hypothetical protein